MKQQTKVVCGLALLLAVVPPVLAYVGLAAVANFGHWTHEYWHPAAWTDIYRLVFGVLGLVWWVSGVVSLFAYLAEEDRHD